MLNIVIIKPQGSVFIKTPPLGIGYLLKSLSKLEGINPVFIDGQLEELSNESLLDKIRHLDPLIIGFQVFSDVYPMLCAIAPRIREMFPRAVLIAGGPHPSGAPEQTLQALPEPAYVVRGEGEEALAGLARGLRDGNLEEFLDTIPNLVYRRGGKIIYNLQQAVDVETYGSPDWERLHPDRYPPIQHGTVHKSTRVVPIITSRGCPYPCTYCAGHLITGKKIRRRSVDDIVDEIEFLQNRYGFEEFIIEDENFTYYREHVLGVAAEIRRRSIICHFSFPNGIRIDRIDEEIVRALKEMGTYLVTVGLESGSERTLKAMKKNLDLKKAREKIALLKRYGIIVNGAFILGFSGETMEDIEATIGFAIDSGVDTAHFGNYLPLPGSEDFNRLVDTGEIDPERTDWHSYTAYYGKIPYHPRDISREELLRAIRNATFRFYRRPRIIWGLVKRMSRPVFLRNLSSRIFSLFGLTGKQRRSGKSTVPPLTIGPQRP
jgi:radical SAM superfamily enzyme YgiQ (UPF0313 family)